jgi:putative oxidoreductase
MMKFFIHDFLLACRTNDPMKKLFSTRTSETNVTIASLILRVGLGSLMLVNAGLDKLMHYGQNSSRFADPFGIGPEVSLALVVFAEFFCSAFLIVGLFTRLAVIPLIIAMLVAVGFAHKWQVFGDGATAALYLVGFLAILFLGPGKASLDRFIGK